MKYCIRFLSLFLASLMLLPLLGSCTEEAAPERTDAPDPATEVPQTEELTALLTAAESAAALTAEAPAEETAAPAEKIVTYEADQVLEKKLYYYGGRREADVANGKIFRYNVVEGREYYLTTSLTAQDGGFPLVIYFDAKGLILGTEFMNTPGQYIGAEEEKLTVPAMTSYIFVNARGVDAVMTSGRTKPVPAAPETPVGASKDISILFVGNSLTQDGIAYLPYLLRTYYPEVNFRLYMWYSGGKTLADHYADFTANKACDIFSVCENKVGWTNSSKTMSWILKNYTFDIVCMQEYFNYKSGYTASDIAVWNNCRNYITSNYAGENGLEFISLFHAPKRDRAEEIYNLTLSANRQILADTIADDIIPIGLGVTLAMKTNLDKLGDNGHLSPDGTHTQEGLPCLVQTYVALLWLLDRLDINKSVYGLDMKMTSQIYAKINVPGANLGSGVIPGSDADNLLAQEVAIQAYKQAKQLFDTAR